VSPRVVLHQPTAAQRGGAPTGRPALLGGAPRAARRQRELARLALRGAGLPAAATAAPACARGARAWGR